MQRNLDPALHPFERAREYTRALNATKLDRLFAKPFVAALDGHMDGVYCMAKHPTHLTSILSGSGDGEIKMWSLSSLSVKWSAQGHKGLVKGLCAVPYSSQFMSVGSDKMVKIWDLDKTDAIASFVAKSAFSGIDHHRSKPQFATASTCVELWDHQRAEPFQTLSWGAETVTSVRFNQTETSMLSSCGTDRTLALYDLRTMSPISKLVMAMQTNAMAWNPMEAFNFTTANEDHNCYTFDMRNLSKALSVAKDHVSAVMDIDYSPTGQEFVTGSYDKTVRIFNSRDGHSRDVYHTKRMQKVFAVRYSMDSKFVLSGSDEGNIRLWKAQASDKLGTLSNREVASIQYSKAIHKRYDHMPEIKRIDRHRRLPKAIKSTTAKKRVMVEAVKRKEQNERAHSKPGAVPFKAERKKHILSVEK